MQSSQLSLFARDDTLFGVCEALGQDFGFNPNYLRIAFASSLLWNPIAVFAAYAVLGLLVAVSRRIAPSGPAVATRPAANAAAAPGPLESVNDEHPIPFARAA